MLKVVTSIRGRATLFIGLDRTNTEKLHKDMPIPVNLDQLRTAEGRAIQDIVIFAEETLELAHKRMIDSGIPLPPYAEIGDPTPNEPWIMDWRG